jgi:hypothetical protein
MHVEQGSPADIAGIRKLVDELLYYLLTCMHELPSYSVRIWNYDHLSHLKILMNQPQQYKLCKKRK